jgi:hypothetical protein
VKIEGSLFHGREPDENRWDFDIGPLDSWSGRVSFNPADKFSFQVSYGFLKSPEAIDPTRDEHRLTASIQYAVDHAAVTAVWGRNIAHDPLIGDHADSFLVEGNIDISERGSLLARVEWVQKSSLDLDIPGDQLFSVAEFEVGYVYPFVELGWPIVPFVGATVNVDLVPADLVGVYGTQSPAGFFVYLGLRAPRIKETMKM